MILRCETILESYYVEHAAVNCVASDRIKFALEPLLLFFKGVAVSKVDIPVCRQYREFRKDKAAATVRRELGVLKAAANHARDWRRITKLEDMPIFELPIGDKRPAVWLFKEELSSLLETASTLDRRVFRFVQLAYHTAGRKESIESLTWAQVDIKTRRINLDILGAKQTNKKRPIVPISENMAAELEILRSKSTTQYVLVTPDNIRPAFDRVTAQTKLSTLSANGMRPEGRLTPHVLRHSRATHLLEDNKSPWAVAALLGDNLKTVLKVYGHVCSNYLEEVLS